MNDDWNAAVAHQVVPQRVAFDRETPPATSRRRGPARALCGVLIACLAGFALWEFAPSHPADPAAPADVGQLADLDSDTVQQADIAQLGADIGAMPGPAPAAQVSAACSLVDQITRPVTPDVDHWVIAHCVADQEPHEGLRYDIGPLDRD